MSAGHQRVKAPSSYGTPPHVKRTPNERTKKARTTRMRAHQSRLRVDKSAMEMRRMRSAYVFSAAAALGVERLRLLDEGGARMRSA